MSVRAIMDLVPMAHSVAILSENVMVSKKTDIKSKDLIGLGLKNVVGIEFVKLESGLIAGL